MDLSRRHLLFGSIASVAWPLPVAAQTGSPRMGGTLTVAMHSDAPIVDPTKTVTLNSHTVMKHICENLVTFDDNYDIIPQLAASYSIEDNGASFRFELRPDVRFHDGTKLTAEDVRYSIERQKAVSPNRSDYADLASIDVLGPLSLRFRLSNPSPVFLTALAGPLGGYIIPKDLHVQQGGEITRPVGTGPYEFVSWQPDRALTLKKFAGYVPDARFLGPTGLGGNRTAYLDEIIFRVVPDRAARVTALQAGEVQLSLRLDVSDYERLKNVAGVTAIEVPAMEWAYVWLNVTKPPFDNVLVRRAVAAAINYPEMIEIAVGGHGILNTGPLHPTQKGWRDAAMARLFKYDPAEARKLLREANYKGEPVELYTSSSVEYMSNAALAMQQDLAAVGIKVDIKALDTSGLAAKVFAKVPEYGLGMMTSSARFDPDQLYYRRFHSSNAVNKWKNAKFDALLEKARMEMDRTKRLELYGQAHEEMMRDVPLIVLFNPSFFEARSNKLRNFTEMSMTMPRFWNVWLDG